MMGYQYGGWVAMSLMTILFWGGVAGLVVYAVFARRDRSAVRTPADRLARDEVTEDELVRSDDVLAGVGPRS